MASFCHISATALCIFLAVSAPVQASQVDEADVVAAVETWVRYVTADARPDALIVELTPYESEGDTVAYIAHLQQGGYCLCGADDLALPVYYYSPRGRFDAENPNARAILNEIETRTKDLRHLQVQRDADWMNIRVAASERANFWHQLAIGEVPTRTRGARTIVPEMMELPLTSFWDQNEPFNDDCPELPPGGPNAVVGCVATAMAQIMYYWKWPDTGVGSASVIYHWRTSTNWIETWEPNDPGLDPVEWDDRLRWLPHGYGTLQMRNFWDDSLYDKARRVNGLPGDPFYQNALDVLWGRMSEFATPCDVDLNVPLNWTAMQDIHLPGFPQAGDDEVAFVCYAAGVAAGMSYGVAGSSAALWLPVGDHAEHAYETHFRYSDDCEFTLRDIDRMTIEIQYLRPFEMSGESEQVTGHAWIVFGYNAGTDPDRQFRVNFGWSGSEDGWYSCDNMLDYTLVQAHLTRIAPDYMRFVGTGAGGGNDGTPSDPFSSIVAAASAAPANATLILQAEWNESIGTPLVMSRPMTLRSYHAVVGSVP